SAIIFSGHFANWELLAPAAEAFGLPLTLIYRRPNNPIVGRLIDRARRHGSGTLVPKGRGGAKALVDALRRGASVALLVDQKMNDGLPIPFFGREAMTAPAVAQLALRFDAPLIPARVERLRGARFRITIQPPMALPADGDRHAAVRTVLTDVNRLLETWIRERPEQWLWLHRRWPD
ncbi:MAG TPA: lysophospholipid acyltransferase family protein, partial [Arenibaculum sp.]|nr:lysophospholipid acyltransferase family protein [Arenibaculum sp.]